MVHLISKTQKIVDPATNYSALVQFNLSNWHMSDSEYIAEFRYFYKDANDKDITINYLALSKKLTYAEVNAIAATVTPDPNLNYTDEEILFLTFGSLAIIDAEKPFGLGAGDWEIITESND